MNGRTRASGMTLIEVLTALAILSLLAGGILSAFRLGHQSYQQLIRVENSQRELVATQDFLRRVLESTYPFDLDEAASTRAFGLEGTAQQLQVTAPMPMASSGAGHFRYTVALEPGAAGSRDLVVRAEVDRHGPIPRAASRREVLIPKVESVEFAYLDAATAADQKPLQWRDHWRQTTLPSLVRIKLAFAQGDSRLWPELAVTPLLTHDAHCRFDVVSRDCRPVRP